MESRAIFDWALNESGVYLMIEKKKYELAGFEIIPQNKARYVKGPKGVEPRSIDELEDALVMGIPTEDIIIFEFAGALPSPFNSSVIFQEIDEALKPLVELLTNRRDYHGWYKVNMR